MGFGKGRGSKGLNRPCFFNFSKTLDKGLLRYENLLFLMAVTSARLTFVPEGPPVGLLAWP